MRIARSNHIGYTATCWVTERVTIKNFRFKALREAFAGKYGKLRPDFVPRVSNILDVLDAAQSISEVEGLSGFHALTGNRQGEYSVSINGNYRITFTATSEKEVDPNTEQEVDVFHVTSVNIEDYH